MKYPSDYNESLANCWNKPNDPCHHEHIVTDKYILARLNMFDTNINLPLGTKIKSGHTIRYNGKTYSVLCVAGNVIYVK